MNNPATYVNAIKAAQGLLYDQIRQPDEANDEYARGIVEVIADTFFGTMEEKATVARDIGIQIKSVA